MEASWGDALALAGSARAAVYSGNATANDLGAILGIERFVRATGAAHYSCLTLDNAPQIAVSQMVFGTPLVPFLADFENSDLIVLVGTDPIVSAASQQQANPRAGEALRRAGREGRLLVVDPRRSATAAVGEHLSVRPGTDVAWLHALASEHGALSGVPPMAWDEIEALTGTRWDDVRRRVRAAARPLFWSGLGVLLGPDGTLGWWLTLRLQAALGGLGRPGGWIRPPSPLDLAAVGRLLGLSGYDPNVLSSTGHAAVLGTRNAASLLPDVHSGRVRSLVVVGGDPWRSLPGDRSALDDLEVVVSIDVRARRLPGRRVVELPATTWLERSDLGLATAGGTPGGYVRTARPVVAPFGAARDAWWIFGALLGRPLPSPLPLLRAALAPFSRDDPGRGRFPRRTRPHPVPVADLEPAILRQALARWTPPESGPLLVTSVRSMGRMNHWIGSSEPEVRLHPTRLPRGGRVVLHANGVNRSVRAVGDTGLSPDAVVWPFGGEEGPNALVQGAPLEPFTGQPRSNGMSCRVSSQLADDEEAR